MSYCVILRGPAGVGKTTVSKMLAKSLGCNCVHIDEVLKEHGLDYVVGEKCVPEKNFLKVNEFISENIRNKSEKDEYVVIEGNFYFESVIVDLLERIGSKIYFFTLKANAEECVKRDSEKEGIGEESVKAVYELVSCFDYGIVIDTDDKNAEQVVGEILSHLHS